MRKFFLFIALLVSGYSQSQPIRWLLSKNSTYDADAIAYFNAVDDYVTITDAQKGYINTWYVSSKSDGSYAKWKFLHLHFWNNANANAINMVSPSTFGLTFINTWTFSASGSLPDYTTQAYANTGFIPNSNSIAYNDNTILFWSGTSAAGIDGSNVYYDMGGGDASNGGYALWTRRQANTAAYDVGNGGGNRISVASTDGAGCFMGFATSTTAYYYKNGSQIATATVSSSNVVGGYQISVGGFNEQGTNHYYSNKMVKMDGMGLGLTTTQAADFYTRTNTLFTNLGF